MRDYDAEEDMDINFKIKHNTLKKLEDVLKRKGIGHFGSTEDEIILEICEILEKMK